MEGETEVPGILPVPVQPPAFLEESDVEGAPPPDFAMEAGFYANGQEWPPMSHETAEYTVGNLRILEVRVFPVRYDPVQRVLHRATSMRVEANFEIGAGVQPPTVLGDYTGSGEESTDSWVLGRLINPESVRRITAPDLVNQLPAPDRQTLWDEGYELLIITRPEFSGEAYRLGLLRQDYGTRVRLAVLDATSYPTPLSIRDFISAADLDNRLETVYGGRVYALAAILLIGDTDYLPTWAGMNVRGHADPEPGEDPVNKTGTDVYYARLRGADDVPDVALGRISVEPPTQTSNQLQDVVDKIERYESGAAGDHPTHMSTYAFYHDVPHEQRVLTGTLDVNNGSAFVSGTDTAFTEELLVDDWMRIYCETCGSREEARWYQVSSIVDDTSLWLTRNYRETTDTDLIFEMGWQDHIDDWVFMLAPEQVREYMEDRGVTVRYGYARFPGIDPHLLHDLSVLPLELRTYGWNPTTAEIQDNWREGLDGIVFHSDHGEPAGWQHPHLFGNNLVALTNPATGWYPIVLSINCSTGYFDNETDRLRDDDGALIFNTETLVGDESFAEEVVRFQDGGGIACIAASRGSDAGKNHELSTALFSAMYPDYPYGAIPWHLYGSHVRLGAAFRDAKFHLHRIISTGWNRDPGRLQRANLPLVWGPDAANASAGHVTKRSGQLPQEDVLELDLHRCVCVQLEGQNAGLRQIPSSRSR